MNVIKRHCLPNHIVTAAALVFAAGFAVCAVIAVLKHDGAFSFSPLYLEGSSSFGEIVRIAVISPWAFIGFENIAHFSEEYSFPVRKVRGILIGSVVVATVLDVNDLKTINDTDGHQAGNKYLKDACMIVCKTFRHSPVFRIGGDEFAVLSRGEDYEHIDELIACIAEQNARAEREGGIVIACGMSRYQDEECVADVFDHADRKMYENKNSLKSSAKKNI